MSAAPAAPPETTAPAAPAPRAAAEPSDLAEPTEPADLSARLESLRAQVALPGLAAAVVRSGGVVAHGNAGVRRAGHPELVRPGDRWHLGSCTKALTATLVARLVEAGELDLHRPVLAYLPDVAARLDAQARERWAGLSLAVLLTNTSGLGSPHDDPLSWARLWQRTGTPTEQRALLARSALAAEPAGPFGTFLYSNANAAIAGHVAEVVLGVPYEDLMRQWLFEPLGLARAGFDVPWDHDLAEGDAPSEPWPHAADGRPIAPGPFVDNPPAIAPAGTVHMTLDDWARCVALHLRGARGEPVEPSGFLAPASFEWLHRAVPFESGEGGYAAGWVVLERPFARGADGSGRCLTHAGSNTTWFAVVWIAPEVDLAVLVATNQGGGDVAARVDRVVAALIEDATAP